MFFIRTTLLVGLGVLVLPTDEAAQARVLGAAKTAMHWTQTFCERNPQTCVQAQQGWGVFVKKAEFAGKMAIDLLNERNAQQPAASPQPTAVKPSPTALKHADPEPAQRPTPRPAMLRSNG